jgi:hypothetical protein
MPQTGFSAEVVYTADIHKKRRVWLEGTLCADSKKLYLMDENRKVVTAGPQLLTRSAAGSSTAPMRGDVEEGTEAVLGQYFVTVTHIVRTGGDMESCDAGVEPAPVPLPAAPNLRPALHTALLDPRHAEQSAPEKAPEQKALAPAAVRLAVRFGTADPRPTLGKTLSAAHSSTGLHAPKDCGLHAPKLAPWRTSASLISEISHFLSAQQKTHHLEEDAAAVS